MLGDIGELSDDSSSCSGKSQTHSSGGAPVLGSPSNLEGFHDLTGSDTDSESEQLTGHSGDAELTAMERLVLEVVGDILKKPVSTRDNFVKVGGSSITGVLVVNRLRKKGCPQMSVRALQEHLVLGDLAAFLDPDVLHKPRRTTAGMQSAKPEPGPPVSLGAVSNGTSHDPSRAVSNGKSHSQWSRLAMPKPEPQPVESPQDSGVKELSPLLPSAQTEYRGDEKPLHRVPECMIQIVCMEACNTLMLGFPIAFLMILLNALVSPVECVDSWGSHSTECTVLVVILPFGLLMVCLLVLTELTVLKWLLLGHVKPIPHKLHSCWFVRWWLFNRLATGFPVMIVTGFFRETGVLSMFYSLMGATLGARCKFSNVTMFDHDLIRFGKNCWVDQECMILGHEVRNGQVRLGRVRFGDDCSLGARCVASPGAFAPAGVTLLPLTSVRCKDEIRPNQVLWGSPAVPVADLTPAPASATEGALRTTLRSMVVPERMASDTACFAALQWLGLVGLAMILSVGLFILVVIYCALKSAWTTDGAVSVMLAMGILPLLLWLIVATVALKWVAVGTIPADALPSRIHCSNFRVWLVDTLLLSIPMQLATKGFLDGTTLWPLFLRALGGKIGSQVFVAGPELRVGMDLLEIGSQVFVGGDCIFNNQRMHGGEVCFEPIKVGDNCVLGNGVVACHNSVVADNVQVGSLSSVLQTCSFMPGSTWMGSPPILIGETRTAEQDENETRLFQEVVHGRDSTHAEEVTDKAHPKIVMTLLAASTWTTLVMWAGVVLSTRLLVISVMEASGAEGFAMLALGLAMMIAGLVVTLLLLLALVALLKRFCCNFFAGRTPFFSFKFLGWAWFGALMQVLNQMVMWMFQGTPLMPFWMRLMGARVGRNTFIDTALPAEIECINIGDNTTVLQARQTFIPHANDRGMLQWAPIVIGDDCSVGREVTMLPFTRLGDGAAIDHLSVVMKGEELPPGTNWVGSPCAYTSEPAF